jgi:hypothetical protein
MNVFVTEALAELHKELGPHYDEIRRSTLGLAVRPRRSAARRCTERVLIQHSSIEQFLRLWLARGGELHFAELLASGLGRTVWGTTSAGAVAKNTVQRMTPSLGNDRQLN